MSVKGSTTIWNDANITKLRELYPTTPACDIADVIGCSAKTVLIKAHELGLERAPTFNRNNYIGRYTHSRGRYNIYNREL